MPIANENRLVVTDTLGHNPKITGETFHEHADSHGPGEHRERAGAVSPIEACYGVLRDPPLPQSELPAGEKLPVPCYSL